MNSQSIFRIEFFWENYLQCHLTKIREPSASILFVESSSDEKNKKKSIRLLKLRSKRIVVLNFHIQDDLLAMIYHLVSSQQISLDQIQIDLSRQLRVEPAKVNLLFYSDFNIFEDNADKNIRMLSLEDYHILKKFEQSLSSSELYEAMPCIDEGPVFGYFLDNELISVAGYSPWTSQSANGHRVADLGNILVYTKALYRGFGYGKKCVLAASAHARKNGYLVQYQVSSQNSSSILLAQSLGFIEFGGHFQINL